MPFLDITGRLQRARSSRKVVLALVHFSLLLDGFLLTVVVPILPDFLYQIELAEDRRKYLAKQCHTCCPCNASKPLAPPDENGLISNETFMNVTDGFGYMLPQDIINENSKVGWLFSSKAIVQLLANGIIGQLTNRVGYTIPLFAGVVSLTISSLGFALANSYIPLFIARAIHGIGAACFLIAGMGILADIYPEDLERSRAMGIALGGQAIGVLAGYPAGGALYQFVGKTAPFMICATLLTVNGGLQFLLLQPSISTKKCLVGESWYHLLRDPYILVAAGALMFPEMAMAMLEPTLPIWLADNMHLEKWQIGAVFIPDSVGFLIGCNAFGIVSQKIGRWVCSITSLLLVGGSLICVPFATQMPHLILPHFGFGFGIGIIDASMMPLLALLVDQRHVAMYGSVYAIAQVAISLAFAIGPSVGGQIVKSVGFPWLIRGMAIVIVVYSPLCYFLKNPPGKEENKSILAGEENGHAMYTNEKEASFNYSRFKGDDVTP
ncbi:synaptic vesicular amine transporter-like [Lineus longissimus]|uniref:synaptic vesicular amine transporter-like n=1 Tax=Lineus longissimus TaxID=88925 RepID=UPI002B4F6652